jgi:uncharacterized damage-inducible protein DinB
MQTAMDLLEHIRRMADYNQTLNRKVYAACEQLSAQQLNADRGAFFHSILGTLNHLVVADIVWLKRFASHPLDFSSLEPLRPLDRPRSLDQILYADFVALQQQRVWLDGVIVTWVGDLRSADLETVLDYCNMKDVPARRRLGDLLCHFFNHQTHHRGQVTTLLSQEGLDVGVTDLLDLIPQV